MTNRYYDLIEQTFDFPQQDFRVEKDELIYHDIPLMDLVRKYHTPMRLVYLPQIDTQIERARNWFNSAIKELNYTGKYNYCYCTKSSHFSYMVERVLENGVQLETSSAFDIDLIQKLEEKGLLEKNIKIIHNGYKPIRYMQRICELRSSGFINALPICDNVDELAYYEANMDGEINIGIRVATEEEPNFEFYTSRLGIRNSEVLNFYKQRIANNDRVKLRMLHFFVDKGIRDSIYYWGELQKAVKLYCELKTICPELNAINIGGGLPIRNSLGFDYNYSYMIKEIVGNIQSACMEAGISQPDIYTEFGKFTVGESGAHLFGVLAQKRQNDAEMWYMIDNSLMNTIPDAWGIGERFIMLPLNKWNNEYTRVNIGGLSCDNSDYYNSEVHQSQVFLPTFDPSDEEPLYIGFFHTGAYQDALSGYGGVQHCLIPSPRHLLVNRNKDAVLEHSLFSEEQTAEDMLKILGY